VDGHGGLPQLVRGPGRRRDEECLSMRNRTLSKPFYGAQLLEGGQACKGRLRKGQTYGSCILSVTRADDLSSTPKEAKKED